VERSDKKKKQDNNSGGETRAGRADCRRSRKSPNQIPESLAVWSEATKKEVTFVTFLLP